MGNWKCYNNKFDCQHKKPDGECRYTDTRCFWTDKPVGYKAIPTEKGKLNISIRNNIENQLAIILGNSYIDLDQHSDICIKEILAAGKKIEKIIKRLP